RDLDSFPTRRSSDLQVWVGDITYLRTRTGWLYLAVVIDLYSRRVVGWALQPRMKANLVCDAFDMAVRSRRPPPGLIFHSDQGSQDRKSTRLNSSHVK